MTSRYDDREFIAVGESIRNHAASIDAKFAEYCCAAVELYHEHKSNSAYITEALTTAAYLHRVSYSQVAGWFSQMIQHRVISKLPKEWRQMLDAGTFKPVEKTDPDMKVRARKWRTFMKNHPDPRDYKAEKAEKALDQQTVMQWLFGLNRSLEKFQNVTNLPQEMEEFLKEMPEKLHNLLYSGDEKREWSFAPAKVEAD